MEVFIWIELGGNYGPKERKIWLQVLKFGGLWGQIGGEGGVDGAKSWKEGGKMVESSWREGVRKNF